VLCELLSAMFKAPLFVDWLGCVYFKYTLGEHSDCLILCSLRVV